MQYWSARLTVAVAAVTILAFIGPFAVGGLSQTPPSRGSRDGGVEEKLDRILQALGELKIENERMANELEALRPLRQEVQELRAALRSGGAVPVVTPKPLEPPTEGPAKRSESKAPAEKSASQGTDVLWRLPEDRLPPKSDTGPKRFSLLGINAGPDRAGNLSMSGKGRYFAPFGGSHAVQVEGEFLYYGGRGTEGRQEGQFDFGIVNRWKSLQAGGFASFKYLSLRQYQNGGALGQAAFTLDYLFRFGRVGLFGSKGFMNEAVLNRANLGPHSFIETYARIVDQAGASAQIGLWKTAYVEGNLGALWRQSGNLRPGGTMRLVQPVSRQLALTFEGGWNETLVSASNSGRFVIGIQFGNWIAPKEYSRVSHPVPVDIPRVRYELLTRRVGNSTPVADAGPNQIGVKAGEITLDGSGSRDPDGDPLEYEWVQISGQTVSISGKNSVKARFTGVEGQTYGFRLKVTDPGGMYDVDRTEVSVQRNPAVSIVKFVAQPNVIQSGQTSILIWETENADSVEISSIGQVAARGTTSVSPNSTAVYRLTARNSSGEVSETATVQVEQSQMRILRFYATPTNIQPGEASNLIWAVESADKVEISSIGSVSIDGSSTVTPQETTTYVLTATRGGQAISAQATVSVAPGKAPRIIRFSGTPPEFAGGESADLTWEVEDATEIRIVPGIGTVGPNGVKTVQPSTTTTYTLTAKNAYGESTAALVLSVFNPVKILDFTASPTLVEAGRPSTLAWKTENAVQTVITGVGPVPVNGSIEVNPEGPTTYTLIAYGKRGNVNAFVIVKPQTTLGLPICVVSPDKTLTIGATVLDGSGSYHPGGLPINFSWRFLSYLKDPMAPPGDGPIIPAIANPASATTAVVMPEWGMYEFEMTVTDSRGQKCSKTTRVNYIDP